MGIEEVGETYLKIARIIAEQKREVAEGKRKSVQIMDIISELGVSGKIVGDVKKLLDHGFISIDEQGRPMFTSSVEEAESFLEEYRERAPGRKPRRMGRPRAGPPPADEAVESVFKADIAKEAQDRTRQYLTIGKTVASAYWKWAQARGIPLEEAVKHDIGKIVSEALEKETAFDELQKRSLALEDALRAYAKELDPVLRLKHATTILSKFAEFVAATEIIGELIGVDIDYSGLIPHYERLISSYLKGGYE